MRRCSRSAAIALCSMGVLSSLASGQEDAMLIEIAPGQGTMGNPYVVHTESGVGIIRLNGALVLESSEGYLTPLAGINEEVILAWHAGPGELSTVDFDGMKCVALTQCPDGWLLNEQEKFIGCNRVGDLEECRGDCVSCTGSSNPVQICEESPGSTCTVDKFGTILPKVDCGTKIYAFGGCFWSGGPGSDISGCGCRTQGAEVETTTQPCNVNQCVLQ